jgi:enoyl-CoA hydratase/carnithine racemase
MTADANTTRIRVDHDGDIAVLTMDGAKKRNALAPESRHDLLAEVRRLMHESPEVRAIVLTGASGHFCAGADVSKFATSSIVRGRFNVNETGETVRELLGGPKPVVAAVEGTAFGMGLSLALACDLVVVARDARLCPVFARIGLIPDTGIFWTLPQRVGMAEARRMLELAQEVGGEHALETGLANRLAEPGEALTAAKALARELAALPPLAVALTKTALTFRNDSLDDSLRAELDYQPMLRQSEDHQAAVRAFMEKRPSGTREQQA